MPEKNADCNCAVQHYHGTFRCYRSCRCRRQECRDAHSAEVRRTRRQKLYGKSTNHLVDAAPAREHLQKLAAMGWGFRAVSRETGIGVSTVNKLLYGYRGETAKTIRSGTSETLLAFNPRLPREHRQGTSTANVDATGSHRRLQALVALGFSLRMLADYSGYGRGYFKAILARDQIRENTAQAITELYDKLWDKKPIPVTTAEKHSVTKAKQIAAAKGWLPPMAWDDDKIDDPKSRAHHNWLLRKASSDSGHDHDAKQLY